MSLDDRHMPSPSQVRTAELIEQLKQSEADLAELINASAPSQK